MKEKYLGLNRQRINRRDIPFNENIEEYELIENTYGDTLIFLKGQYEYITDDLAKFLSNNQIYTQWKKL